MPNNKDLTQQEIEIEKKVTRIKELANIPNRTVAEIYELGDLELSISQFTKPYDDKVKGFLDKKAFEKFGMSKDPKELATERANVTKAHDDAVSAKLEIQRKIKDGITSPEAETYVKQLVKDNKELHKQLVLMQFENKALKANGNVLSQQLLVEIDDITSYMQNIANVADVFSSKMKNIISAHKVKEENESNPTGTK